MIEKLEDIKRKPKTDWKRVDAFTDEELTANALADPDNQPLTDEEYANRRVVYDGRKYRGKQKAPTKERISICLSPDVLKHFRASGKGWQSRIDDALKSHIDAS